MLSHNPQEQGQNLWETQPTALDRAHHVLDMPDDLLGPRAGLRRRGRYCGWGRLGALLVQRAFFDPAFGGLVVGHAALIRSGLLVRLSATERAAEVHAPGITRMGEKEEAAALASSAALSQRGAGFEKRSQELVVL